MNRLTDSTEKNRNDFISSEINLPETEPRSLPVIKLSFGGFLLFANTAGVEFLDALSGISKAPALTYLVRKFPDLLDPECSRDISIQLFDTCYSFSIIPFKEDGYTGIYCFRSVKSKCGETLVA